MHFEGAVLAVILSEQASPVQVCDVSGVCLKSVSGTEAAGIVRSNNRFYGVGHSKRIRYIQPLINGRIGSVAWHGSSRTQTQRIRNDRGEIIAPDFHIEFKPLVYSRPQG
jgi:hypothetical protein